jgi:hypothetical protein
MIDDKEACCRQRRAFFIHDLRLATRRLLPHVKVGHKLPQRYDKYAPPLFLLGGGVTALRFV